MSIRFYACKKTLAVGPDKGAERYFAQIRNGEAVDFDKLCRLVSELSSVTPGDVELVLNNFSTYMINKLEMGHIIQLGSLGNFRVVAGSKGAEEPKQFHPRLMKSPRILFTPGKLLRRVCAEMKFEKIKPIIREEEGEPCPFPH